MSRLYEMYVTIRGFNPKRKEAIQDAANLEWDFDDWNEYKGNVIGSKSTEPELTSCGQSSLTGGETEDEFAERFAKAVMEANGKPCEVEVRATYMEELPNETYTFGKGDYRRLVGKKKRE